MAKANRRLLKMTRRQKKVGPGTTHAPPPPSYLDIDAPPNEVLDDFFNAMAAGSVAAVQAIDEGLTQLVRGASIRLERVPAYDFGHMSDVQNPTADTIRETDWYRLDNEAIGLQASGTLRLPFDHVIFL